MRVRVFLSPRTGRVVMMVQAKRSLAPSYLV